MTDSPDSMRAALAGLRALGGDGLVKQMVAVFIEHSAGRISAMQTAIDLGDLTGATVAAHTLKGSARQLGLTAMAEACQSVEFATKQGDATRAQTLTAAVHESYAAAVEALKVEAA